MPNRRRPSRFQGLKKHRQRRQREQKRHNRQQFHVERLEERRLLAIGPELFAVRPDEGQLLQEGDVLNVAPREFNLLFKGGADIDPSTIDGNVRLVRSGNDGTFGDGNEVVVNLGHLDLDDPLNPVRIVMRPSSSATHNIDSPQTQFPDDTYRIEIFGEDNTANGDPPPLSNTGGDPFNEGVNFSRQFRLDLGAEIVAVVPQPVNRNTQRITIAGGAPTGTFTLEFGGQTTRALDVTTVTAGDIQTALHQDLDAIGPDDVQVTGVGPFDVSFKGQLSGEQLALIDPDDSLVVNGAVTNVHRVSLTQASDQIVVYFNNDDLDPALATDPQFYRLVMLDVVSAGVGGDQTMMLPSSVSYDAVDDTAVLTFDSDIPDGTFRLDVGVSDESNDILADAPVVGTLFNSTNFEYLGFIGDINQANDDTGDTELFKVNVSAGAALTVTATPDDTAFTPNLRMLDQNGVALTPDVQSPNPLLFTATADGDLYIEVTSFAGVGSFRLDVNVTGNAVSNSDINTTFSSATDLGVLGIGGATHSAAIEPQNVLMPPYPGGLDEPGHRVIQAEAHVGSVGVTPFAPGPITQRFYNFRSPVGADSQGNPFPNLISEQEKDIVREIYEIYGSLVGIEFIEAPSGGTTVMKGDLRAANPAAQSGPGGIAGLGGASLVVLDNADFPSSNSQFGGGFSNVMFHEIGHSLGLGHSYDFPSVQGSGVPGPVRPGDADIAHLNRLWRPDSTDIDLYQFDVAEPGFFSAEIFAERPFGLRTDTSLLNSALTLFDSNGEVVARNDDYFSNDSFIGIELDAGVYYLGVTSTGNIDYDPNIVDSGFGGITDGAYDLVIDLLPAAKSNLADTDGTLFDGDADGQAGGTFSFWFQSSEKTIFVDKANDSTANAVDGNGALTDPYDTISFAMEQAGTRIIVPERLNLATGLPETTVQDGDTFTIDDGTNPPFTFEFDSGGGLVDPLNHTAVPFTVADDAATLAGKIEAAVDGAFGADIASVGVVNADVVSLSGIATLDVSGSQALLSAPNLVRIVGAPGLDGDIRTRADNVPYLIGLDNSSQTLPDGQLLEVPQGVTAMVDAGTLFKLRKGNLEAGSSATGIDRRGGAIQILGTPENQVFFRSFRNDSVGGDSDGVGPGAGPGDFGGVVFRADSDLEDKSVFLNWVNHASMTNGGGKVFVNSVEEVFTPVHMIEARPTVSFNTITSSADAAISANPNSFDDSLGRIGPDVHGNMLVSNTVNGLFIRIETQLGEPVEKLDVTARFDDTDITHVITENLQINGNPGGPFQTTARLSGRLHVDPGVVVKLGDARIEMERGASSLIAEGTAQREVIFTSINDDRFGGSGSFDTTANGVSSGTPGDWGGLIFNHVSHGSIDHALIAFGGGEVPIEGNFANFNAIEVHQANLRLTNSTLQNHASGFSGSTRNGRGSNDSTTIYVRGAQPLIIDNVIQDNAGAAISINANALQSVTRRDPGRSTGPLNAFTTLGDNEGPLIRLNRLDGNGVNGMEVRAEELTTATKWDDTDIVHVVRDEIIVNNHHTLSGLRLQSSKSESLVVKLQGTNAGFTANGKLLEIDDRIGGTVQILGSIGHPVVLTSLADDSVGSGFTPEGAVLLDTNGDGIQLGAAQPRDWRSILLDRYSNDRNVKVVNEAEDVFTDGVDTNSNTGVAQVLGTLAPDEKSGDENRRLGFEVHGFISPDDPSDLDVYTFDATAGSEVWFDIDQTDSALDTVIELVNVSGTVTARSIDNNTLSGQAQPVDDNPLLTGDFYTTNFRDAGMRVILPGTPGTAGAYFLRVRSNPSPDNPIADLSGGLTSGVYRLQIRLQQVDEFPGSTVRFADIRYAENGIDIRGLPSHSNLVGETAEQPGSQTNLGNLLESDRAAISVAGQLGSDTEVDNYSVTVQHAPGSIQSIGGVNDAGKTVAAVFDIDYADGATRPDSTVAVFDSSGLILIGRESNIEDDQGRPGVQPDTEDLSRGSLGGLDPFIGPVTLPEGGSYSVSVMSNLMLPDTLDQFSLSTATSPLARLEPVNSLVRIAEDHIGFSGYTSGSPLGAIQIDPEVELFNIGTPDELELHVVPFNLGDVPLFVTSDSGDDLHVVNAFQGSTVTRISNDIVPNPGLNTLQDIAIRSDGVFYGYRRLDTNTDPAPPNPPTNEVVNTAGNLVLVNAADGALTDVGDDNVPSKAVAGATPQPNGQNPIPTIDELTFTDDVDALTFDRTGTVAGSNGLDPTYDVLYSVREEGRSIGGIETFNSKLYRGDSEAGNGSAARVDNTPYGFRGDIQPFDVSFARATPFFADANNNGTVTIQARTPGIAGNDIRVEIRLVVDTFSVVVNPATATITVTVDDDPATSIQTLVDLINDSIASQWVTAAVTSGNSATQIGFPRTINLSGGDDGADGPLQGYVTGMTYLNGLLYGVTSGGELLRISEFSGNATRLATLTGVDFQGLAPGPKNVAEFAPDGSEIPARYANLLFAVTDTGQLYAFDTLGNLTPVFDSDGDGFADNTVIDLNLNNITGIAFSPADFNLWHPTERRGSDSAADEGHGIHPAFDLSRTPSEFSRTIFTGGDVVTHDEDEGGLSFYFGLEQYQRPQNDPEYFRYTANTQYGIPENVTQIDLTSTPAIGATQLDTPGGNINLPGALGSLETHPFSLEPYDGKDKPAVYFNYFLDTQNHPGQTTEQKQTDPFRDSARVYVSDDGGNSWDLVATNNSERTTEQFGAELPHYWSDSSTDGLRAGIGPLQQQVQELFDNTGTWRQARIDLTNYAGADDLKLRFEFSTYGAGFGGFGAVNGGGFEDNSNEGFYIDDVIIGLTERGEMVTGPGRTSGVGFRVPEPVRDGIDTPLNPPDTENLTGPYQLEVRRAEEHAFLLDSGAPDVVNLILRDTNERIDSGYTIVAPTGASLADGLTFSIIGRRTETFEFDLDGVVTTGNHQISFSPADDSDTVADKIRNAINGVADFGVLAIVHTATSDRVDLVDAKDVLLGSPPVNVTAGIAATSLSESAGMTTVDVTLEQVSTTDTVVTLDIIDGGAAGFPNAAFNAIGTQTQTTVIIPAGSLTPAVPVDLFLIDNSVADGNNTVIVVPTTDAYSGVSDKLTVTDDDNAFLELSLPAGPLTEGGASAPATVTRMNSLLADPLTVFVSTLDPSEIRLGNGQLDEVEPNSTIIAPQSVDNADWTRAFDPIIAESIFLPHISIDGTGDGTFDYYSFTVPAGDNRVIADIDNANFTPRVFVYDAMGNLLGQSIDTVDLTSLPGGSYLAAVGTNATLGLPGGVIGGEPAAGDTYRLQLSVEDHPLGDDIVMVEIPAGAASVDVDLYPIQDLIVDGDRTPTIVASAPGFATDKDDTVDGIVNTITVTDSATTPTLTLSIIGANPILESGGFTTGRVTLSEPRTSDVVVNLLSSDTSEATVPVSVTLEPGSTTATFTIAVIDDPVIDGDQAVAITAIAAGYPMGSDILTVLDDVADPPPGSASGIGLNFTGATLPDSGFIPPDTMGAVGPDHIVEFLNGRYNAYDKTTGAQVQTSTLDAFWSAAAGAALSGTFDPRIVYDPTETRWFAAAIDAATPANTIYVAVSDSDDPTAGWQSVQFIGDTIDSNRFNDYETLAVDADGVYLATNNFGAGFDVSIYSIPKADLLLATPTAANLSRFENLDAAMYGNSIQPALDFGPSDGRAVLLSAPGGTSLVRSDITGADAAGATLSAPVNIPVTSYIPAPNARQQGTTDLIESVSPRFTGNVVEVGDSLWAVHTVEGSFANAAIRWYEIDETNNNVLQSGTIEAADIDYLDPSISANTAGNVVIGMTGSGPNQFAGAMVVTGNTVAGVTTFGTPITTQAGNGTYSQDFGSGRIRWGDYSATVLDPVDPMTFWTFQEFVDSTDIWGVQITEINTGLEQLDVSIVLTGPDTLQEDGPTISTTADVVRNDMDITNPLDVTITFDPTELTINGDATGSITVQIAANVTTEPIMIDVVNDTLTDGIQSVVLTPNAIDHNSVSAVVDVVDAAIDTNTSVEVALASMTISEPFDFTAITATRSDTIDDIPVNYTSSDPTEALTTGASVFTTGFNTASGFVIAQDDTELDGRQFAIIEASTAGQSREYDPIRAVVDILDDETRTLAVAIADASISEGDGLGATTGTVSIEGTLLEDLTVFLHSSDPSEMTLRDPITGASGQTISLVIPAGDTSAMFYVDTVNEFISDGTRIVGVTAFAPSFDSGMTMVDVVADATTSVVESYRRTGDSNRHRDQGQLLIESNVISNVQQWGINVQFGARDAGGQRTYPGAPINFALLNADQIAPGAVISNNVIAAARVGGISFAGSTGSPTAIEQFGRITNNTIFGSPTGIRVADNASPTVMNNILADLGTAITTAGAGFTEINSNHFVNSGAESGSNRTRDAASADTFVDAARFNFYPKSGSDAIDSSLNTLGDRSTYASFKNQLGIPQSTIFAPDRDVFGQLRVDDPNEDPLGGGAAIFKDRGAVERADDEQPFAELIIPLDNDAEGKDLDPNPTVVYRQDIFLDVFSILLGDGPGPDSPFQGTGVDPLTVDDPSDPSVSQQAVQITRNGVQLDEDVDYTLGYNANNDVLLLTPLSSLWEPNSVYVITLDNQQITDFAENPLRRNQPDGSTTFTIILGEFEFDYGDAPNASYGTLLASNGARHVILPAVDPDVPLTLGTLIDPEDDGQPSLDASGDDTNGVMDDEDGVTIGGIFIPGQATNTITDITIEASKDGVVDGWIDLNSNGTFELTEKVLDAVPVVAGTNAFQIDISTFPVNVVEGDVMSRFRISATGGLFPTGIAVGGEVEDYSVRILSNSAPTVENSFSSLQPGTIPDTVLEDAADTVIDLDNVDGLGLRVFNDVDLPPNPNADMLTYSILSNSMPGIIDATLVGSVLTLDYQDDRNGGPVEIVVETTDHGGLTERDTLTISVTPVNDPPLVLPSAPLFYTENDSPTIIGPGVQLSDIDSPNFDGGSLTVEITVGMTNVALFEDRVAIETNNPPDFNPATGIDVRDDAGTNKVYFNNIEIGAVDPVNDGLEDRPLTINLGPNSSQVAVQQLARAITYENLSENPGTLDRKVVFSVVDGDGTANMGMDTGSATMSITVTSVNDPPDVTLPSTLTYTEVPGPGTSPPMVLASSGTTIDLDSVDFDGGLLRVEITNASLAEDQLSIEPNADGDNDQNTGIDVRDNLGTTEVYYNNILIGTVGMSGQAGLPLTINLNGSADVSDDVLLATAARELTRAITYQNTSQDPDDTPRTVVFTVDDGDGDAGTATMSVEVIPVNDPPVPTVTPSGPLTYIENKPPVNIDGFTVGDVDSADFGSGSLTISIDGALPEDQLSIISSSDPATGIFIQTAGVVQQVRYNGVLIGEIDLLQNGANGQPLTANLIASATLEAVRSLGQAAAYLNSSDVPNVTTRTIRFTAVDGDGVANGGNDTGTATTTLDITPVNDAPVVGLPTGPLGYFENDPLTPLDPLASIIEPDWTLADVATRNFDNGSLTVSITNVVPAEDQLGINTNADGDFNANTGIFVIGSGVYYDAVQIGTTDAVQNGVGGQPLSISLNAAATVGPVPGDVTAVRALARAISYENLSEDPDETPRTVVFTAVDGDGTANDGMDTGTATMTVNVTPVNDAPVLDNGDEMGLDPITEDETNNNGNTVAEIIASSAANGGNAITDVDAGDPEGVALIGANGANPIGWEFSNDGGATWNWVGNVSDSAALLLTPSDRLRYVPDEMNGETAFVILRAWDQSAATTDVTAADPVIGPFSANFETASIEVTPVNDAPVLDNSGDMSLDQIDEDAVNNAGNTVTEIIASALPVDAITDVDGDPEGIAVVSTSGNNANGWEYSTNGGATWTVVSASSTSALLLDGTDRLRYVPDTNNGETASVTFHAWDQSDNNADVSAADPVTGPFSSATETATIIVTDLNDAPIAVPNTYGTNENTILNIGAPGILGNDLDVDIPSQLVLVESVRPNDTAPPITGLPVAFLTDMGARVTQQTSGAFTYNPTVQTAGAIQALPAGQSADDYFRYTARDDGGLDSNEAIVTITVTGANDAPVARNGDLNVNPDGSPILEDQNPIDGTFDAFDIDTGETASLTYTILSGPSEGSVSTTGAQGDSQFTFDPGSDFQDLGVGESRQVTFTYEATDTHQVGSNTATVTVTVAGVNDRPIVDDISVSVGEDGPTVTAPFLGTDIDEDALTYDFGSISVGSCSISVAPGSLADNFSQLNGSFTFDPQGDFQGLAANESCSLTIGYTADDQSGAPNSVSQTGLITVTVSGVNDAPIAMDDFNSTDEDSIAAGNVLTNDVEIDESDSLRVTSSDAVSAFGAKVVVNANGGYTYDPTETAALQALKATSPGTMDTFRVTIADEQGVEATQTVTITVSGLNDAPVARPDLALTTEDLELTVGARGLLSNDSDADQGETDTLTVVPGNTFSANLASVSLGADGSFTYDPRGSTSLQSLPAGQSLTDTFSYFVRDVNGVSSTGVASVTVAGINDAPMANDDGTAISPINTTEDAAVPITPLSNDSDPDNGDMIRLSDFDLTSSMGAQISISGGNFVYDPTSSATLQALAGGASVFDVFTYEISDNLGVRDTATVTVTVAGVNDVPVGDSDSYATDEETSINVSAPGLLSNDTDADNDLLSVITVNGSAAAVGSAVVLPSGATLTVLSSGEFSYDPATSDRFNALPAGGLDSDSFRYQAWDGTAGSDNVTVTISITGVDDLPVVGDDNYQTTEDDPLNNLAPGLLLNDSDPDGDPIAVDPFTGQSALGATISLNTDGSFSYDPRGSAQLQALSSSQQATDTFSYTVNSEVTGIVTVTVGGLNDAPTARDDSHDAVEDSTLVVSGLGVLDNDFDLDTSDTLTVSDFAPTSALGATVSVNSDGTFTYDPTTVPGIQSMGPGQFMEDTFTYEISDSSASATATVTVTVEGRNDAPVVVDDTYVTNEDQVLIRPASSGVLSHPTTGDFDAEGNPLTAQVVVGPTNGQLIFNASGSFTYAPNADFNGVDTFTYQASDGTTTSDIGTVTINVTPIEDDPTATDDQYGMNQESQLTINAPGVLANDVDVDGEPLQAVLVTGSGPANGNLTLNLDGSFTYAPDPSFFGTDSFAYEAVDETGRRDQATVTINIANVHLWQNSRNRLDVNDDGFVTPQDVVIVLNRINRNQDPNGELIVGVSAPPPPFVDVNGDDFVTSTDARIIINALNRGDTGEGEGGEGEGRYESTLSILGARPDVLRGALGSSSDQPRAFSRLAGDEQAEGEAGDAFFAALGSGTPRRGWTSPARRDDLDSVVDELLGSASDDFRQDVDDWFGNAGS